MHAVLIIDRHVWTLSLYVHYYLCACNWFDAVIASAFCRQNENLSTTNDAQESDKNKRKHPTLNKFEERCVIYFHEFYFIVVGGREKKAQSICLANECDCSCVP